MSEPSQAGPVTPVAADPLIDEIRAIRRKISDRFANDVDRLIEHLREVERQHPDRVISPTKATSGDAAPTPPAH